MIGIGGQSAAVTNSRPVLNLKLTTVRNPARSGRRHLQQLVIPGVEDVKLSVSARITGIECERRIAHHGVDLRGRAPEADELDVTRWGGLVRDAWVADRSAGDGDDDLCCVPWQIGIRQHHYAWARA